MRPIYIMIMLISVAIFGSCASDSSEQNQKNVSEFKFQITLGINADQIALSKSNGRLENDLKELKAKYENRLENFGIEDFAVEVDEEKKEIIIGLDQNVDKSRLFRMLTANAVVRFYETYKALEVLNEFYADNLPKYLLQYKDQLVSEEGIERDSMELLGELALTYFPAYPSVDYQNMETANLPYFLVALENDTAMVSKAMNDPIIKDGMPDLHDLKTMWGMTTISDNIGNKTTYYPLYCLKKPFDEEQQLGGKHINSAKYIKDETGNHAIAVEFNMKGKELLENLTTNNSGRFIAITIQNMVVSAPMVQHAITGGQLHITGNFSKEEAEFIASILRIGELPLQTNVKGHNLAE